MPLGSSPAAVPLAPKGGVPGPRVTILGTGAMACLIGARLHHAGARVTLAGTWAAGLAAIRAHGIRLDDGGQVRAARVRVAVRSSSLAPADLVLVLVKSHQTSAVVPAAAAAARGGGLVVTLQNGLDGPEILASAPGCPPVAPGATSAGATLLAPGVAAAGGPGATVLAGPSARAVGGAAAAHIRQLAVHRRVCGAAVSPSRDRSRCTAGPGY